MSDSVRPHRRQPTRLPRPWDSPGKNTGVVAISLSNVWKWRLRVKSLSCVRLFATPWTAAYQAPPPLGFSRQEYWSGLPLDQGSNPGSLHWKLGVLATEPPGNSLSPPFHFLTSQTNWPACCNSSVPLLPYHRESEALKAKTLWMNESPTSPAPKNDYSALSPNWNLAMQRIYNSSTKICFVEESVSLISIDPAP